MKIKFNPVILIGFFFFIISCGSAPVNFTKYKSEKFIPSSGLFKILFPSDLTIGIRVADEPSTLKIYDDFGGFYRLDYYKIPPDKLNQLNSGAISEIEYLKDTGEIQFFEKTILPVIPNASIVSRKTFNNHIGLNYFLVIHLPKGSSFTKNGEREDIHRGINTFRFKDVIFVAHTQEKMYLDSSGTKDIKGIELELFKKTQNFLSSLEINR